MAIKRVPMFMPSAPMAKDATKELARLRPQLQSQENDIRRQADELDIARSKVTQLGKVRIQRRICE